MAQGYANLGVDLSYVNIYVDEQEVQIIVLEPQVTDAYIDMSQSRIYERELGTFRVDTNGELENLTWQKAHDKMIDIMMKRMFLWRRQTRLVNSCFNLVIHRKQNIDD